MPGYLFADNKMVNAAWGLVVLMILNGCSVDNGPSEKALEEATQGKTASLSIHELDPRHEQERIMTKAVSENDLPPGTLLSWDMNAQPFLLRAKTNITEKCLSRARASQHPEGFETAVIFFQFNDDCTARFAELTQENLGKRLAIVMNGEVASAPYIRVPIMKGAGYVESGFDLDEAREIAFLLNKAAKSE